MQTHDAGLARSRFRLVRDVFQRRRRRLHRRRRRRSTKQKRYENRGKNNQFHRVYLFCGKM